MSWYDYLNPVTDISYLTSTGQYDPTNDARGAQMSNAAAAGTLGDMGTAGMGAMGAQLNGVDSYLQGQMRGQNSVSAEQLRQGLQQNLATQQAMAAGAAPQNQAMAARNAAQNMASLGYGMSGQQAVAGLQERQNAAQQLGSNILGARGQDVNAATGGYGVAAQGYGSTLQNPQKTPWSALLGGAGAAAGLAAKGGGS